MSRLRLFYRLPLFLILVAFQAGGCAVWLFALPSDSPGISVSRLLLAAPLLLTGLAALGFGLWEGISPGNLARFIPPQHIRAARDAALFLSLFGMALALAGWLVLDGLARGSQTFLYRAAQQRLAPLLVFILLTSLEVLALRVARGWSDLISLRAQLKSQLKPLLITWLVLGVVFLAAWLVDFSAVSAASGSWGGPGVPVLEWQVLFAWVLGGLFLLLELRWARRKGSDALQSAPFLAAPFLAAPFLAAPFLAAPFLAAPFVAAPFLAAPFVAALIWLFTAACWVIPPLVPGYFATPPRLPNFEVYPFSDGLIYAETAQSILVGSGMSSQVVPARPLYALFLAGLHALAGQDTLRVASLQALILALYPALVYLLAARLGMRAAGVTAALLLALRDVNANLAAPFTFNLTYSRLYFSEIPSALLIGAFTWIVLAWLKRPASAGWKPLLAGGVLGLAVLVRTQAVVLLAPVLLISLPVYFLRGLPRFAPNDTGVIRLRNAPWCSGVTRNDNRLSSRGAPSVTKRSPHPLTAWAAHAALLLAGVLLVVSPWLARNAALTGGLMFDHPVSQTMVVAQRYNDQPTSQLIPMQDGETLSQFSNRLAGLALGGFLRQPGVILWRAAGHLLNSQVSSLQILPVRADLSEPRELLLPRRAFWQEQLPHRLDGSLPALAVLLALFGLGVAAAWRAARWLGLLPLGIQLFYNSWTALFLSSGDRFLVPVDWAFLLYFSAGLIFLARLAHLAHRALLARSQVISGLVSEGMPPLPALVSSPSIGWRKGVLLAAAILCAGASLPLSEWIIPARYASASQADLHPTLRSLLEQELQSAGSVDAARSNLQKALDLLDQPGDEVFVGRALYPRYYEAGEGEPETAKRGYAPEPRARLVFSLVGPTAGTVVFYASTPVEYFPHAADVWLVGEGAEGWLTPRLILVESRGKTAVYTR